MRMRESVGKKLSLRLDYDLAERLENYASRERVPVSFVLRHLVIRFLRPVPPADLREGAPVGVLPQAQAGGQGRYATAGAEAPRFAGGAEWRRSPDVEKFDAEFRQEVCALFDEFIASGLDVKEATKRTNFAMKAKKHPWATYDVVSTALRKAGRFRKAKGRPRG